MIPVEKLRTIPTHILRELNSAVVAEIRARSSVQRAQATRAWALGMKASFWSKKKGATIRLRIDTVNRVTVLGTEIGVNGDTIGGKWKVSASILSHV